VSHAQIVSYHSSRPNGRARSEAARQCQRQGAHTRVVITACATPHYHHPKGARRIGVALVAGIVSAAASVSSFVGAKAFAGGDDDGGSAASQSLAVGALALIVLGAIGMSTTRLPAVEVRDEALNDIINRPIMTPLTSAPASTSAP